MLAVLLAARSFEISWPKVGDVRIEKNLVVVARQIYPGKGGLITVTPGLAPRLRGRASQRVPVHDRTTPPSASEHPPARGM
jgi:hypothetical protein